MKATQDFLSGLFSYSKAKSATVAGSLESGMIVSVESAEFLPYLGFWNRIVHADKAVITDTSRFKHRSFMNRNRVRTEDGWGYFTLPVNKPRRSTPIKEIRCRDFHEVERTWAVVESNYRGRAPYWDDFAPGLKQVLRGKTLFDVNISLIRRISEWLEIPTPIVLSSEVSDFITEDNLLRSMKIVKATGADTYLTGAGDIGMLPARFSDWGINFMFQEFIFLPYPQIHPGWHPGLSVVDCLFTHGAEYTRRAIDCGWFPEEKPNV